MPKALTLSQCYTSPAVFATTFYLADTEYVVYHEPNSNKPIKNIHPQELAKQSIWNCAPLNGCDKWSVEIIKNKMKAKKALVARQYEKCFDWNKDTRKT